MRTHADPERAKTSEWFFKTAPGGYGHGDKFLGVPVPVLRRVVRDWVHLSHVEVLQLLADPWHEVRLLALLIWVRQYAKGDSSCRDRIAKDYLCHDRSINNWDLVDLSAYHILGPHDPSGTQLLPKLAGSDSLWHRRMAIVATMHHLRQGDTRPTFTIARQLLSDKHDLIHKATGWLLREAGKTDGAALRQFIQEYGPKMARTTLRYAIERFSRDERTHYLHSTRQADQGSGRR